MPVIEGFRLFKMCLHIKDSFLLDLLVCPYRYAVVQFCPWFKFSFLLFWGMVIYDNEFETKKNII